MVAGDDAMRRLEKMFERDPVLRDVLNRTLPRPRVGGRFDADIDVVEQDDRVVILLDLPGVDRDGLTVEIEGTKLVVEGTKTRRHPAGRVKVAERPWGRFRREFQLPAVVDAAAVSARLVDGVLTVSMPRVDSTRSVKIDVGT
jgi:HSP20 family protein